MQKKIYLNINLNLKNIKLSNKYSNKLFKIKYYKYFLLIY
jgi:hypothetical protein